MPIFEIDSLQVVERLPGWRGRYFHSATMTFAHYEFDCDARIHEHRHHAEEVYEVLEGELEIVIDDVAHIVGPGRVAVVPANARHFVKALTNGKVIVVDHPVRREFG
jgi:quercetin dioxygenase-like cupin family protein